MSTSPGPNDGFPCPFPETLVVPGVGTLTLRPAGDADYEILRALHRRAMQPSVAHAMGAWNDAQQGDRLARHWSPRTLRFVECGEDLVGTIDIVRLPERATIFLSQLYIEPTWQGRGIGTALLRALQDVAARTGGVTPEGASDGSPATDAIELHVLRGSDARRLYERVGFALDGGDPYQDYLRWTPAPVTAGPVA